MTSLVPLEYSESGSAVLKDKVTMGVWKSLYRTPTPPPVVEVEFRTTAAFNQPRKSYHMGWAQVVEELSWKFNNPNKTVSVCSLLLLLSLTHRHQYCKCI